jgi:uncharacterized protein (DUF488 family)
VPTIYTVGHSTRTLEDFLAILKAHNIELLADVRSFPASRRYPHFGREALEGSLTAAGISYAWLPALGGRRKTLPDSPNGAWRNASFRGYADYMQTPEFAAGLGALESSAREKSTAIMCSEAVPWRCHRSLISDALIARDWKVVDIYDEKTAKPHAINPMAKVENGILRYPLTTHQNPLL